MNEMWLPVVGWAGLYEVSDAGRVRSLDRTTGARAGKTRRVKGRTLAQCLRKGYRGVTLKDRGREQSEYVHRLVLAAFCGAPSEGMEGCHNSGNTEDNHLTNLRWDTRSANHLDKNKHGTMLRGERWRRTHASIIGPRQQRAA